MLGKNIFYSVLAQVPIFILGVVSGVFSTRVLGEDAKGAFTLLQANSQLIVMLFSFGINTAIVYFISSSKKTPESIVSLTFITTILSSIALLISLFLSYYTGITKYLLPSGFNSFNYVLSLFALFFYSFLSSNISSIFRGYSKFKYINTISIVSSTINALIFIYIYFYLNASTLNIKQKFDTILLGTIVGLLLTSIIWIVAYLKEIKLFPKITRELVFELKPFMLYSSSIFIGILINFFNYRLDLWIVNLMVGSKDLSHYSLAGNLGQIILFVSVTIASVILPFLSSSSEEEREKRFLSISKIAFLFFLAINLIAFIVSPYIIPLFYGEEFLNTILPFQLILPGILFSCMTQLLAQFLISININKYNIIACSIGLLFTVVFDLVLIKRLGIIGASIATSIAYFVIFMVTYSFVITKTNRGFFNIFIPSKEDLKLIKNLVKN